MYQLHAICYWLLGQKDKVSLGRMINGAVLRENI